MLVSTINMSLFLLFGLPGGAEWIIILFAILLLFGGKKIPELMKGLGKGIREFNNARANIKDEIESGMKEDESKKGKELKE
jgi:sec-independent protein translocase protein TatA